MLKRYAAKAAFTTKVEERSSLPALLPHWHDLAERSAEDNVYYAPNYALALLDTVDAAKQVRFVTVWDNSVLMGFLPIVLPIGVPGVNAAGRAWATDYTSSCTPLIDRDHLHDTTQALVGALANLKRGEWVLPLLNEDGIVCKAIIDALDYCQAPWASRAGFQRAMLHTGVSFDDHMKTHIGSKRRRKFERNRRRLEECGTVAFRTHTSGTALDGAVEDFLRIEAGGWKGKRGTALSCKPRTTEFARKAFGGGGPYGKSRVDLLLLNDEPIAAGVIVFSGDTGFSVKGSYDERYAVWGAGLLLEIEILKSFLTEKWAKRIDSATNGAHTIDRLWPDRSNVADLTFSFARAMAPLRLSAHNRVQDFKSNAKERAKRVLGRN
jgi:CelD/BcsL family acetyltransferase involved in cellulose biosynthesis